MCGMRERKRLMNKVDNVQCEQIANLCPKFSTAGRNRFVAKIGEVIKESRAVVADR